MSILKHLLSFFILFFFLLSSFTYSQSITGVAKKTGGIGLAIQGVKVGKEGLKQLTTYGQELVAQDNQTNQTLQYQNTKTDEIFQQSIKQNTQNQNIQTNQQTNNILDNLASSISNDADKLKSSLDKSTKPLQNTVSSIGNLFSKIQDSVSSDDNSKEQSIEQEQTITSLSNNNKDNNGSDEESDREVIKQLTTSQAKSVNKIQEINHMLTSRNNLSGKILDNGHVTKLQNARIGLEREVNSLQNSLKNPSLTNKQRVLLQNSINEAQTTIGRINQLVP